MLKPYSSRVLIPEQEIFNLRMSSVRQAVEWGFGKIIIEFAFLDFKKNHKLLLQDVVSMYKTATILTNCHTCLYSSQTAQYFDIEPPMLEEYLLWSLFIHISCNIYIIDKYIKNFAFYKKSV